MQYQGGKAKIAGWVSSELQRHWHSGMPYVEPFVGGASVVIKVSKWTDSLSISDIDPDLIALYKGLTNGFALPAHVTESEYAAIRAGETCALKGFVKFACSWGGKPWGGFARSGTRNYALNSHRSLNKLRPVLSKATIECREFSALDVEGCLIYCDPPYEGTTGYEDVFCHASFWDHVRYLSSKNTVLVSEYKAPSDFSVVSECERLQDIRFKAGRCVVRERLFRYARS